MWANRVFRIVVLAMMLAVAVLVALRPHYDFQAGYYSVPVTISMLLFLAEFVPIGLLGMFLLGALIARKNRLFCAAAFVSALLVAWFGLYSSVRICDYFMMGFQRGCEERAGYPTLRKFAREIAPKIEWYNENEGTVSEEEMERFSGRYPFLKAHYPKRNAFEQLARIRVEDKNMLFIYWGGALAGHWGVMISLDGKPIYTTMPVFYVLFGQQDVAFIKQPY